MVIAAGDTGMIAWANAKDATDAAQAATLAGKLDKSEASSTFGRRTKATFYPEDFGAKGDGVTDDTAAFNAMVSAGVAAATASSNHHVIFQGDSKVYLLAGAPTHPNGIGGPYAQIPLPVVAGNSPKLILEFRGASRAVPYQMVTETTVNYGGTFFLSTASGGLDASYGVASVIGGPAYASAGAAPNMLTGAGCSNICIVLDGWAIRRPANPSIGACDFSYCQQAKTINQLIDTAEPYITVAGYLPTYYTNFGLLMPTTTNACITECAGDTFILGCYVGIRYSEHFTADHIQMFYNVISVACAPGTHVSVINHLQCENEKYVFAEWSPSAGRVGGGGLSYTKVNMLDIASSATGPWDIVADIANLAGSLYLEASYLKIVDSARGVPMVLSEPVSGDYSYTLRNLASPSPWFVYTPNPALYAVRDSFTRPDSGSTLGSAPSGQVYTYTNTWGVISHAAYCVTAGGGQAIVPNVGTDQDVSVEISAVGDYTGVVARYDGTNYYFFDTGTAGVARLYKKVGATFTSLASPTVTFVAGDRIRLVVHGSQLTMFKNDLFIATVTDTAVTTGTGSGLVAGAGATTARFKNFLAT